MRLFVACRRDASLPSFLRGYTRGAVLVRVLSYGVELLQFTKRYDDAADQLRALLQQRVYHADYRGRWSERLALNLDFHLKRPAEVRLGVDVWQGDHACIVKSCSCIHVPCR